MSGRFQRALTRNTAVTVPDAEDPRLRGRTYAIPFDRVWSEALALVDGGIRGWSVVEADDHEGLIRAGARSRLLRRTDQVTIRVVLDRDAQTRVDARAVAETKRGDMGSTVRHIGTFFHRLDRALAGAGRHRPAAARPG